MSAPVKALHYHKQQQCLEITFSDEGKATFSAEFLRVYSPSAEVTGHTPEQAVLVTNKRQVKISKIEPVGNYAVKLCFDDGHDTGLYSWSYLEYLRANQTKLWQHYLERVKAANAQREEIIPIQIK